MKKYLIVATHPDDETLGAGGTILRKKAEGNEVFVLNMTQMDILYGYRKEEIQKRNSEISKMVKAYDLNGYYNLNLRPAGLDSYTDGDLVEKVSRVFNEVRPNVIILPYYKDIHSDHRITFNICHSCTKSFRYPFIEEVLMMEVPSETDYTLSEFTFKPNYFIDISDYIDEKVKIANNFEGEMLEHPFPRSEKNIKAYATIRGATVGVHSAEAFMLVKRIE